MHKPDDECGPIDPPEAPEITDEQVLDALQSGKVQFQKYDPVKNSWADAGVRLVYHGMYTKTILIHHVDETIDLIEAAILRKDVNGCATDVFTRLRNALAEEQAISAERGMRHE